MTTSTPARIAVIGAGVLGSAVAAELAVRNADVTIFDADRPGSGTSGLSFAWVNSSSKEPAGYHDLNVAGMAVHRRQTDEGWDAFVPTGRLAYATDPTEVVDLAATVERLVGRGYPAELISADRARELEPTMIIPGGMEPVGWFPSEGHCWPDRLIRRQLDIAGDHGARFRYGEPVRAIEGGRVMIDSGPEDFDHVVLAIGRWTQPLAATAGITVPMVDPDAAGGATVGYLAETGPVSPAPSRVIMTPRLHLRPAASGGLLLQALDLDHSAAPRSPVPDRIQREFEARLAELLPDPPPVIMVRVGQRSLPADGLPVTGFGDAEGKVYVLASHSGVTLAPLLGELVAGEVLGQLSAELEPYRPNRFY